jgi:hypothetical protein
MVVVELQPRQGGRKRSRQCRAVFIAEGTKRQVERIERRALAQLSRQPLHVIVAKQTSGDIQVSELAAGHDHIGEQPGPVLPHLDIGEAEA